MELTIGLKQYMLYLSYMASAIVMIATFISIYISITPIKEMRLIREGCMAASLSFGGALIGFSLTLASSIAHSDTILNFVVWGACAAFVQLIVFFIIYKLVPNARTELEDNNIAVGGLFCAISLAIGIINAACLS